MINQFYIDYIKAIENPDRVGWNGKVWTAPQYKGYDKNQRGYGIDIVKNDSAKRLTQNRPGQWLTEGEADKLMKEHLLYVYGAAQKHIEGFDNLSDKRKAALLGMLYRGDSVNKNRHIININEPDDNKFFESINNYYKSKGLNERAKNSSNFFNNQTNFLIPMKWQQWEPPMKFKSGGQVRKMQTASGGPINWLRKRIYTNIEPFGYNDVGSRLIDAVVLNKNEHNNFKGNYSDPEKAPALYLTIDNIWGEYLHIPEKERRYSNGKYKIKNNGNGTFSLPFESMEDIMQTVNSNNPLLWGLRGKLGNSVVGEYDVHRGYDKNGDYLKYIDHWRINPYDVKEDKEYGLDNNSLLKWYFKGKDDASFGLGTPVEILGKYYLDDIYNVKGADRGGHYLPEVVVTGKKKQGGKMNITKLFKEGGQIRKMLTASGGPIVKLSGKSLKEVDETNNYNRNKAKGLFKGIISGKVLPTMSNIGSMLGAAYNGWLDPETTDITGDVPNPGMRDSKLIVSSVLTINKFKNILKNYNPYAYNKPKLPEIKISNKIVDEAKNLKIDINNLFTDNFIKYLEKQTGRKIKRIPYKNTEEGNIYKEGFSFVDENGKEIAHIAGNLKGKNVWVESSYVDPEFRHKGLGKLMYFDFNDNVYNTYGTTLHSSALQRLGYVDGGGMSPSNRLWKSLTDNKLATTEGSGFDWWNIMADPSKIKTAYRKQGGKMNILEFLKNGSGIHIKEKNKGKFTSYCGGKVTDECILKGKNSSNPAIRKRATFAANARKWKHKEGGIIKASDGTKTSWVSNSLGKVGNFLNSDFGKSLFNGISSSIFGGGNSEPFYNVLNNYSDTMTDTVMQYILQLLQQTLALSDLDSTLKSLYDPLNPHSIDGDIVGRHYKWMALAPQQAQLKDLQKQLKELIDALNKLQKTNYITNALTNTLLTGFDIALNYKPTTKKGSSVS